MILAKVVKLVIAA